VLHVLGDDPDLAPREEEAEAWSVTVDKKTLKKMSAKDIKRQDHIWELIQTEKSHCRTLHIMQKVFSAGMLTEVGLNQDMVNRIFPSLADLVDIHSTLLQQLLALQAVRSDRNIESIGPTLSNQFTGSCGQRLKSAYGKFCAGHIEAVQLYKDLLKSDRKFQTFIKKCSRSPVCKRLAVPEVILLVTQRMTKYPLLIEPIIKTTKDCRAERDALTEALAYARACLVYIDSQVDAREKKARLFEIFHNLDARSSAMFKGNKFKKSHLLHNNRRLLHEGTIRWMSARGKAFEVLAVILSDLIFFLSENNQKYTFFTQDNKSSVVSLNKLLVREKSDTRDSKGMYLISQCKHFPEMYELVCSSPNERKDWICRIRKAISNCPDTEESEGVSSAGIEELEEERRIMEARSAQLCRIIDQLHHTDNTIQACCDSKMQLIMDMLQVYTDTGQLPKLDSERYKDKEGQEYPDLEELLKGVMREASSLATMLLAAGGTANISRSKSSAGEHESSSYTPSPLPKRAETFAGFDAKGDSVSVKRRHMSGHAGDGSSPDTSSMHGSPHASPSRTDSPSRTNKHGPDSPSRTNKFQYGTDNSLNTDTVSDKMCQRRRSINVSDLSTSPKTSHKERVSRRMSTSFLHHLLTRPSSGTSSTSHTETEETANSRGSSERGSTGELSTTSSGPNTTGLLVAPQDACACLAQLTQHIHAIVCVSSQQCTEAESFKVKLAEANARISCLSSESDPNKPRSSYQHDKQLEELRNLQEAFNQERQEWYKVREKERNELDAEKVSLDEQRDEHKEEAQKVHEEWDKQRDAERKELDDERKKFQLEHAREKEELQRQKDALQIQIELFNQQRLQSPPSQTPAGHNRAESPQLAGHKAGSPGPILGLVETIVHKRSQSDELYRGSGDDEYNSGSLKEPLNMSNLRKSPVTVPPPVPPPRTHESVLPPNVPLHLLSTTNEQKVTGVVGHPKLPRSLGSGVSVGSRSLSTSSLSQMMPFKLANDSKGKQSAPPPSHPPPPPPTTSPPTRSAATQRLAGPALSPPGRTQSYSGGRTLQQAASLSNPRIASPPAIPARPANQPTPPTPAMSMSPPSVARSGGKMPRWGDATRATTTSPSAGSVRHSADSTPGLSSLMHLAEKRPKSASPSPQHPPRPSPPQHSAHTSHNQYQAHNQSPVYQQYSHPHSQQPHPQQPHPQQPHPQQPHPHQSPIHTPPPHNKHPDSDTAESKVMYF